MNAIQPPESAEKTPESLQEIPAPFALRVCITGSPRAGKTSAADKMASEHGLTARHTDHTIPLGWSAASAEIATWFEAPGPWICEGVAIPRALRKWLAAHPEGMPCDVIFLLDRPREELSRGQETMRKGIATVWAEIRNELARRGVEFR